MEIEKAFKRLLIKNPFYGLFCLSLPKVVTRKHPTMCVSKQGISCQLNINPDFWEQYTDGEQIALLQHELSHIALQHIFMHESFANQRIFNLAADTEVNSYIKDLPKDGVTHEWISQKVGKQLDKGIGTKRYYEEIQEFLRKQRQQSQQERQEQEEQQQSTQRKPKQDSQAEDEVEEKKNVPINLTAIQKKCLKMWKDKKPKSEIASALNITETEVKKHLMEARKRIKAKMKRHG